MATTAVIAGTATAVSGGIAHHQQEKYNQQAYEQQQQMAADQAAVQQQTDVEQLKAQMSQMQAQQAQQAMPPSPAPIPVTSPAPGNDMMAQLQQLTQMKQAGMLTDEEFAAAKARLLAG
jgi:hypothetical protein